MQPCVFLNSREGDNSPGKSPRVDRKTGGSHGIVEAPLSSVLTAVRELNRPRYPKLQMRLAAVLKCGVTKF